MGGGDLNMKKGHHPATMKNLEKKWLAEQKRDSEKKQIEQLQRELEEERAREDVKRQAVEAGLKKKSDRVDWMYQHMAVDREQYLLGKAIDKRVDPTYNAEQEKQALEGPGALFAGDAVNVSNDVATKIREDPLFHIRKKEDEHKKALLNNPIKMKQIQQILKDGLLDKKGKKKKKAKKKRSDSNKDDEKKHKREGRRQSRLSPPGKDYRDRWRDRSRSPLRDRHQYRRRSRSRSPLQRRYDHYRQKRRSSSTSSEEQNRRSRSPRRDRRDNRRRSRSHSPSHHDSQKFERHDDRQSSRFKVLSKSRTLYDEKDERRSRSVSQDRRRTFRSRSPRRDRHNDKHDSVSRHPIRQNDSLGANGVTQDKRDLSRDRPRLAEKTKLDKETMERKRLEMMENAKQRDKEREARVQRYRDEAAKEEDVQQQTTENGEDAGFLHSMKMTTYLSNQSSVEDRIKRNINSLQRTNASLDKHFLKKYVT
ncbi:pre-mRNA-splicing factor CWC25 homolog [Corticium candelabrum]|uniref:pre-mRNA-splicing factor CWC25 homolog n=1 Tax=Corticium candelabrum TaxID=121492 RepID=UPI002E26FAB2|nr:pre-mRNA-splicing factor CWC25 homolog [Corticium candelabrum]